MARTRHTPLNMLLGLAAGLALGSAAWAQAPVGTAITYHAEFVDAGSPVSGVFDLKFRVVQDAGGTLPVGPTLCFDNVAITNGRIVQRLDFGAVFGEQKRFLVASVRPDAGGDAPCSDPLGFVNIGTPRAIDNAPVVQFVPATPAADHAAHAAHAVHADDAQTLDALPPSHYQSAANLTGTLPGASLQGTYPSAVSLTNGANEFAGNGAGLTDVIADSAVSADAVGTAAFATNTLKLNGRPASFYLLNSSLTGRLPDNALAGTFASAISLTNPANFLTGTGTALTGLNAGNFNQGSLPSARFSGTYDQALSFTNAGNSFTGNGAALTGLNAANFTTGTVPLAASAPRVFSVSHQTKLSTWSTAATAPLTLVPGSGKTFTIPPGRWRGFLSYNISGLSSADNTWFLVVPTFDNVISGTLGINFYINPANVHLGASGHEFFVVQTGPGTVVQPGTRTLQLRIQRLGGTGSFLTNDTDSVSWSLTLYPI